MIAHRQRFAEVRNDTAWFASGRSNDHTPRVTNASDAPTRSERIRAAVRVVAAAAMVAIGIAHFANPEPFVRIVPAILPAKRALVFVSGAFEIAGGLGLLVPSTRRLAGLGLIALYVAVFPANINMAVNHIQITERPLAGWIPWARLPLQIVFIVLAWWVSQDDRDDRARTRR